MRANTPPFTLPHDAAGRKAIPLASGLLDYFPDALIAVASLSFIGNAQHNPGKPLHWDRSKSTDHDDCLMRHFMARGTVDTDKVRHRTKVAWRALAALQEEIERDYLAPVQGIPAESAYLASFSPNGSRIATAAEIEGLRDLLTAEELRGFGIGDAEPRDVAETATTVATSKHPMAAEVLRDHDERLNGPEDHL